MDKGSTASDFDKKSDFFKHVFNFEDDGKAEMLNMLQYSVLGIIPIILLNKFIHKFIPESDIMKGTPEIIIEILAQLFSMFLGIIMINRMITYVPTYSGIKYMEINPVNIVLGFLMIVFSIQTKLGDKVNLILRRLIELWDGTPSQKNNTQTQSQNGGGAVRITQPISPPIHQPSQSDTLSSSAIGLLPQSQPGMSSAMQQNVPNQPPTQNNTNPQQMYSGPNNPLDNTVGSGMEPMAANDGFGGAFGSLF